MTHTEIDCFAPAKLNLFLHVVGRREDGYHRLQTLFRFLDHGDRIRLVLRLDADIRLLNPLPGVPPEQDLCQRAAALLQAETGCRMGVDIRLDKRLPLGGGLGGGSSNAASVLLGLNRLWRLGLDRPTLQALGLRLGADVPVFVFGRSAFAEGVGEILRPAHIDPASYVVLIPPVHVSTPEIFRSPALTRDTPEIKIAPLSDISFETGFGHNDLQPVVTAAHPPVKAALDWLNRFGEARMTGSGACVFAGFANREQAERVFARRPRGIGGFVADGIDRHPMFDFV